MESDPYMPENTFRHCEQDRFAGSFQCHPACVEGNSYPFRLEGFKSNIELEGKDAIVLHSIDEYKLKAVNDVLQAETGEARGVAQRD